MGTTVEEKRKGTGLSTIPFYIKFFRSAAGGQSLTIPVQEERGERLLRQGMYAETWQQTEKIIIYFY